ncbi:winged helix-turn-helix transcriptional regulator [Candidatus Bathyarchaeota archaeon]|nr:winged helix-turn-helix transcriptional regulator [Candidatus Bathyarchaeota archaeon]
MDNRYKAKIFRALADPTRLEIIDCLRSGEKCVCEIVSHVKVLQPIVSRHLAILKGCGLIKCRRHKNRRFYSVSDPVMLRIIDSVTPDVMNRLSRVIIEEIA